MIDHFLTPFITTQAYCIVAFDQIFFLFCCFVHKFSQCFLSRLYYITKYISFNNWIKTQPNSIHSVAKWTTLHLMFFFIFFFLPSKRNCFIDDNKYCEFTNKIFVTDANRRWNRKKYRTKIKVKQLNRERDGTFGN